jgi:LysM repeat protein
MDTTEEKTRGPVVDEPRYCPACGAQVAELASTCLMCGSPLGEEAQETVDLSRGPGSWKKSLLVVLLGASIVGAGAYAVYTLLTSGPSLPEPQSSQTPTASPTSSPTPTRTAQPTATPTPIPPLAHQVQPGETLLAVAETYDTTVDAILGLNPDVEPNLLVEGQILLIPAASPTPAPTATLAPGQPTPTPPEFLVHVVASGETLSDISEKYGIAVELIQAANDLPLGEDTIQVNQSLVIPISTPEPTLTPTPDANATPTPRPTYAPPPLLSPPDKAEFVGDQVMIVVQWASVSTLRHDEWYRLELTEPDGGAISATVLTRATAWRVPSDLLPKSATGSQKVAWKVGVVRESVDRQGTRSLQSAGQPSPQRTFYWLVETPTPTPRSTPGA